MSTFITKPDYSPVIEAEILDRLTDGDDTKLDDAENMAIEMMRGYLAARYDVAAIFSASGSDRNPIIVRYAVDLALWEVYSALPPNQIPELRKLRYDAAMLWLRRVQKEEVNPPDLPRITDGTSDYVQHGGNTPRSNHIE